MSGGEDKGAGFKGRRQKGFEQLEGSHAASESVLLRGR